MALGRIVAILLGSKLRVVAVGLGLLVAVAGAGAAAGILGAPSVAGIENHFGDVNETTTDVHTDIVVSNPNPVGVQLGGTTVDYAVEMNGITMATGTKAGVGVETGNSTVNATSRLHNDRIPEWWVSHLQNGETTALTVDADVHSSMVGQSFGAPSVEREIETDISSSFDSTETQPIDANQPLVSDPVLYLNETEGEWGEVTEAETPIVMAFTLYNPKDYPISASSIGYDVTMNGLAVGEGQTDRSVTIPPGETRTIEATTVIDNGLLDEWWVSHLERNQVTDLEIQFYARFDLSAAGAGDIRVPLDSVTHEIETDMFGNKDEYPTGSAENASASDGDASSDAGGEESTRTPTPDGTDGDSTATDDGDILSGGDDETEPGSASPTSTATETPTETDTATDDGGDGGVLGVTF
ncbi:LEA14-like dessication related protein [Halomicrobium zhouii]|uniref:LEA14-like dessication related protein n=1 Tax=Halomicrobium zhouii TaxID=767519 RepID=A0A1I6L512_9EURY|nr:LEA type 2 family protein [Halomicrobium zhouii]SFR98514.1 LEA14-like dessication related protein [Halomicrobium zhouii]